MITSMTGFGDAQLETNEYSFLVEIKSLNNRFLKTVVKTSDSMTFAEPEIERILRSELTRGSVHYTLHFVYRADTGVFQINHEVLQNYLSHLERMATLHNNNSNHLTIDLSNLLQMPGACQMRTFTDDQQKMFLGHIKELTVQAVRNLKAMRQQEGMSLRDDLAHHCQKIKDNLSALNGISDTLTEKYRQRIQQRVNAMLAEANLELDEEQLRKEVAIFAERSDINEEVSRLQSHLQQFEESFDSDEPAGRKLDFLTQEMLREANTIASKANDSKVSHHVVEIKVGIDRLKEQTQNIE